MGEFAQKGSQTAQAPTMQTKAPQAEVKTSEQMRADLRRDVQRDTRDLNRRPSPETQDQREALKTVRRQYSGIDLSFPSTKSKVGEGIERYKRAHELKDQYCRNQDCRPDVQLAEEHLPDRQLQAKIDGLLTEADRRIQQRKPREAQGKRDECLRSCITGLQNQIQKGGSTAQRDVQGESEPTQRAEETQRQAERTQRTERQAETQRPTEQIGPESRQVVQQATQRQEQRREQPSQAAETDSFQRATELQRKTNPTLRTTSTQSDVDEMQKIIRDLRSHLKQPQIKRAEI